MVGVAGEVDPEQLPRLTLTPVQAVPNAAQRREPWLVARNLRLHVHVVLAPHRVHVKHNLEALLFEVDGGQERRQIEVAAAAVVQVRGDLDPLVVGNPDRDFPVRNIGALNRAGRFGEMRCDLVGGHSSRMLVSLIEPPPTTIGTVLVNAGSGSAASRRW